MNVTTNAREALAKLLDEYDEQAKAIIQYVDMLAQRDDVILGLQARSKYLEDQLEVANEHCERYERNAREGQS